MNEFLAILEEELEKRAPYTEALKRFVINALNEFHFKLKSPPSILAFYDLLAKKASSLSPKELNAFLIALDNAAYRFFEVKHYEEVKTFKESVITPR